MRIDEKFTFINFTNTHQYACMYVPRARNDWWKYLQITAVVYFMKTTARLSQWLARNHVHIYHIFETYGIHIFSSRSNINCTQLKSFFLFTSNWTNFNIFARSHWNKYIHSSENGFIYKNTYEIAERIKKVKRFMKIIVNKNWLFYRG